MATNTQRQSARKQAVRRTAAQVPAIEASMSQESMKNLYDRSEGKLRTRLATLMKDKDKADRSTKVRITKAAEAFNDSVRLSRQGRFDAAVFCQQRSVEILDTAREELLV